MCPFQNYCGISLKFQLFHLIYAKSSISMHLLGKKINAFNQRLKKDIHVSYQKKIKMCLKRLKILITIQPCSNSIHCFDYAIAFIIHRFFVIWLNLGYIMCPKHYKYTHNHVSHHMDDFIYFIHNSS